jgi:uncharacterized membrane protein
LSGKSARRQRKRQQQLQQQGHVPAPRAQQAQYLRQVVQEFSGPLPPPNLLDGYENIVPGAAARILTLAEEEAVHRRRMERGFARYRGWSLFAASLIALVALVGGLYLTATGHSTEGLVVVLVEIGTLVTVFLVSQFRR